MRNDSECDMSVSKSCDLKNCDHGLYSFAPGRRSGYSHLRCGRGLERGGNGSGRLLGTGDQREQAGSGDQLAEVPATGKAWGHSGVHRAKPEGADLNMPALLVGRQSVT